MPFVNELLDHNRALLQAAAEQPASRTALTSRYLFEPSDVMALLRSRIVGQDAALAAIEATLQVIKVNISDPARPLSVMLLIGPTGVGKTEIVRLLAQAIQGRADAFCRIDMNTLAQAHYAAALTGAPPGYVGSKEGATLFEVEAIEGSFSRPGIVLFDEIEKASPEVVRSLLNVLDQGQLTLSAGNKRIDFRNSLIFMTSNIGAQAVWRQRSQYAQGWRRWLGLQPQDAAVQQAALEQHFDPEFLNRIDRVLTFGRIDRPLLERLFEIELTKLNQRLAKRDLTVWVDSDARALLLRDHDARYGARALARQIRTVLEPLMASYVMHQSQVRQLKVTVSAGRLAVSKMHSNDDVQHHR